MTIVVLDRAKTPISPACFPKRESVLQTAAPGAGLFALARVWRERRRIRRQLADMSERELQDVGTCRSEIECEIAKPFWQPLVVSNVR